VDLSGAAWRTSSYSGGNGGQCVEVAAATAGNQKRTAGICAVRDSKDPRGPVLVFSPGQWRRFTASVKAGRFGPH
jgi:hypothetical protein